MLVRSSRTVLARQQFFRFRGCLHEQHPTKPRCLATANTHQIPSTADDKSLVDLFDQPGLSKSRSPFSTTGLFGHPSLTHPRSLVSLAESTLVRAQLLTQRILDAQQSDHELAHAVKNLDRLSDMLCGVIDLAELVRNAHPDRLWVEAGNHAYETLCEFMNVLNTHTGLNDVSGVICIESPDCA